MYLEATTKIWRKKFFFFKFSQKEIFLTRFPNMLEKNQLYSNLFSHKKNNLDMKPSEPTKVFERKMDYLVIISKWEGKGDIYKDSGRRIHGDHHIINAVLFPHQIHLGSKWVQPPFCLFFVHPLLSPLTSRLDITALILFLPLCRSGNTLSHLIILSLINAYVST